VVFLDDVHAQLDAFIADEHCRAGNKLANLMLTLSAERAIQGVLGIAGASLTHVLVFRSGGFRPNILANRNKYRHSKNLTDRH
jgi:hypothetical protein